MKKSIVACICISLIGIWGCSTDEELMNELVKENSITSAKSSGTGIPLPEIVSNQLVIQFKDDNLTEEEKYLIRDAYKNKHQIDIEQIETCDCDNDRIELWTVNLANSKFVKIEELVSNAKGNDDEGDVETDLNFYFQIRSDRISGNYSSRLEEKIITNQTTDAVNIAILDTGIDYDFFPDRFLYNSSGSSSCEDEISGWDFVNRDNDPRDDHGHGTVVAKIITNQLDRYQIPYTIMAVKSFDSEGRGSYWTSVCGINHIAKKNDSFIVNTSFGFYKLTDQDIFKNIIEAASDRLLLISSAGNLGIDTDIAGNEHFPSGYDSANILTVGGYIKGEYFTYPTYNNPYVSGLSRATYSNYGTSTIDALAPFDEHKFELIDASNSSYTIPISVQGTSFANAEVTARAAQLHRETTGTPLAIKQRTLDSGYRGYSLNGYINQGKVIVRNIINSHTLVPVSN